MAHQNKNRKDEPPMDPAPCLKLSDVCQYGTTASTASPRLVDNMDTVKAFTEGGLVATTNVLEKTCDGCRGGETGNANALGVACE